MPFRLYDFTSTAAAKLPKVMPEHGKDWPAHQKIKSSDYHAKEGEKHAQEMEVAIKKGNKAAAGSHAQWRDQHNHFASRLRSKGK